MNVKRTITVVFIAVAMSALALDYCEVIDVQARQRYPWNGLVDIDFTLDSRATEPYLMNVIAYDNVGKTNLPVRSVYTEGVSQKDNPCMVTKDTTRIVWDADTDLPDGFKCTNVLVTCQDTRTMMVSNLYMIVDISGGANAASYPVTYTNCPPSGGWTEEHKTTKLVLRRVEAGSFMMGSPVAETGRFSNEAYHKVTLTKPYYIGVFEVTERQYAQICGNGTGTTKPKFLDYCGIRGNDVNNPQYSGTAVPPASKSSYCWPDSSKVDPTTIIGKLRTKTGLPNFDLPTEAQWECAARGGCVKAINLGLDYSIGNACMAGRVYENREDGAGEALLTDVTLVGCYMPNALGLYDMLGNACEFCVDAYTENLGVNPTIDPVGGSAVLVELKRSYRYGTYEWMIERVVKGGGYGFVSDGTSSPANKWGEIGVGQINARKGFWTTEASRCGARSQSRMSSSVFGALSVGFRVCHTVAE